MYSAVPSEYPPEIRRALVPSEYDAPVAFYVGVIDVLQRWTVQKKLERAVKRLVLCLDGEGLSAIDPESYRRRFIKRVVNIVFRRGTRMRTSSARLLVPDSVAPTSHRSSSTTLPGTGSNNSLQE